MAALFLLSDHTLLERYLFHEVCITMAAAVRLWLRALRKATSPLTLLPLHTAWIFVAAFTRILETEVSWQLKAHCHTNTITHDHVI